MKKDALLEIGCEELPSSFVPMGMDQLKFLAEKSFSSHGLSFKSIDVYGTPRRLAILVHELAVQSAERTERVMGPPLEKAKDASGAWTQAALGFAKKVNVAVEKLAIEEGRLCLVQHHKGVATRQLLATLYPEWIRALQFPKAMTWEASQFKFPRPIRWLAALYGTDLVSFKVADVKSGKWTMGLGHYNAKKVQLSAPSKYVTLLKNQCVLPDPAHREEAIHRMCEQAVKRIGGDVVFSAPLLKEVTHLVEHPVAILGQFDESYLKLPREVLITCLQHHQKFFPVQKHGSKELLPHFIGIRNGMSIHQDIVREGYMRVLAARLADAHFFYAQDMKTLLADRLGSLKGVLFQKALGSMHAKVERLKLLLERTSKRMPDSHSWFPVALRAADLCKNDLVTQMVGEFPELQGVMARVYASEQNEPEAVSRCLEEHYWPITLTSPLPTTPAAAALALVDKLDTLAGDFAVGLIPTGSADPYGLRRAAVGVLRILEDQKWALPIEGLIEDAFAGYSETIQKNPQAIAQLKQFMIQRLSGVVAERSYAPDEIEAILGAKIGVVSEALARLVALKQFRTRPEYASLVETFKRVANLIRHADKSGISLPAGLTMWWETIKPELFEKEVERSLFTVGQSVQAGVSKAIAHKEFSQALSQVVALKDPLNQFFKEVMVMDPVEERKMNRINLLMAIYQLFEPLADFSKLQNQNI